MTMQGIILIVQETRFTLRDAAGVAHLFVLGPNAAAAPEQLRRLVSHHVRVRYHKAENVIGHTATAIEAA